MNRNNLSVGIRLVCFVLSDTIHKGGPIREAAFCLFGKQTEIYEKGRDGMKRIVMLNCLRATCSHRSGMSSGFQRQNKNLCALWGRAAGAGCVFSLQRGDANTGTTQEWRKRSSGFYSFGLTPPIWAAYPAQSRRHTLSHDSEK